MSLNINITFGEPKQLDSILKNLGNIMAFIDDLTVSLAQLKANVAELTSTSDAAQALLVGLTSKINELVAAGSVSGEAALAALADIGTLSQVVEAEAAELHDAVAANTPAA